MKIFNTPILIFPNNLAFLQSPSLKIRLVKFGFILFSGKGEEVEYVKFSKKKTLTDKKSSLKTFDSDEIKQIEKSFLIQSNKLTVILHNYILPLISNDK